MIGWFRRRARLKFFTRELAVARRYRLLRRLWDDYTREPDYGVARSILEVIQRL